MVTEFNSAGSFDVTLLKEQNGPDASVDSVTVDGKGWYVFDGVPSQSSKYYFQAYKTGGANGNYYSLVGELYDHGNQP